MLGPSVVIGIIPPWLFPMAKVDINLNKNKEIYENNTKVYIEKYIQTNYFTYLQIFTDVSKVPESGVTCRKHRRC